MAKKWFHPRLKMGFDHHDNIRMNIIRARKKGFRYDTIARAAQELANLNEHRNPKVSNFFRGLAHEAFRLHRDINE